MLVVLHTGLAGMLKMPHWELNDMESKALGDSMAAAMRHLDIRGTQKTVDFVTFGAVLAMTYVPRVIMTVEELNARKSGGGVRPGMGHNGGPPMAVHTGNGVYQEADAIGLGPIITGPDENPSRVN